MSRFFFKKWGWVHTNPDGTLCPNASVGFTFGRSDYSGCINWDCEMKWDWLHKLLSHSIRVGKLELSFRWFHPGEWMFHVIWMKDYQLKEG